MKRVLLLGATGLVGSELLRILLAETWAVKLVVVGRRPIGMKHQKIEEHVFDLAEMDQHADVFAVDHIFCALGTTIKTAGSRKKFREVDYHYPLAAARIGLIAGAEHYLLVSALGASSGSRVFYNRVKGELEDDLRALDYSSLTIARPSLLLGPREQRRTGEEIAKRFGWLMPPKYRPIEASKVARALIDSAKRDIPGVRVLESREMQ